MERASLIYREPTCPLEYTLGVFTEMQRIWCIYPSERLRTYAAANGIACFNFSAKKQSDLWQCLNAKEKPSLLYIGFDSSGAVRLSEFKRMVSLVSQLACRQQIPLLVERTHFLIQEVPWLLEENQFKVLEAPFSEQLFQGKSFWLEEDEEDDGSLQEKHKQPWWALEIASSQPATHHTPEQYYTVFLGTSNWLGYLSALPGFFHREPVRNT